MNNGKTKSFSFLAIAAFGGIAFNLYRFYKILLAKDEPWSSLQIELSGIFAILFMAVFLVLYYKRSIWSWWIIPFCGPLAWMFRYLQHPFEWKGFFISLVFWVLICYFFVIRKYEDYKTFLKEEK